MTSHQVHIGFRASMTRSAALLALAALLAATVSTASAAVLITDNFTTPSNSNDVNFNVAGRQAGPLFPFSYTPIGGNHQVGNTATDVGQTGGITNGNYLLLAGNSGITSTVQIGAALAKGGPLTIKFDMYLTGPAGDTDPTKWGAFTLRAPGDGFPVANAGEFGWLFRRNGAVQMFQTTSDNGTYDVAGLFPSPHWEMTFTDTAKTGSAFAGNGSVLQMKNGVGASVDVPLGQLSTSGLVMGLRNLDNRYVGIDNLEINGVASLAGDANGDGFVNLLDFNLISNNFLTSPAVPGTNGDLNQDGVVDQKDFRAWRVATGAGVVGSSTAAPEPASVVLAGLFAAAAGLLRVRSKN